ncbi:iron-sulfur cluster assembly scaffold protein [Aurantiacibacter spongiae]|uniref:Iron-sulfur cluster assembly scaffold protein n=1 Tax=Aurantiacibacter spongiae TaxID=2488860 RepID=A0A3N5CSJ2_9SPHN|nr:iron-sulfur cluster assembly scaffold protein [Aurantiacibacter spongiae]RPF70280.1 iron-sulfur cluster assembly scaffold protein [Aurantiacibacter spongiae]
MSADRLYTPQMLAAAVELAAYPPRPGAALHARARAAACGSTLALDLDLDEGGNVAALGLRSHACAVGQASAAVFARHVRQRSRGEIVAAHAALRAWLAGEGALPDWPDLELIAAARDYPGRHEAILLPWKAALDALSSPPAAR